MPNVYLCSQHKIAKLQRTCFARAVMWDETYELKKPIDSDVNLLVEYSLALQTTKVIDFSKCHDLTV